MIDAPMTAREEALQSSVDRMATATNSAMTLIDDLLAGRGITDDRLQQVRSTLATALAFSTRATGGR